MKTIRQENTAGRVSGRPKNNSGLRAAVAEAIARTQGYLLRRQNAQGYWVGELEADASVAAGYVPLMYFMYGTVDPDRQRRVVNQVRSKQNKDGSWSTYYGGPGDLSTSIQVYLALKLAGIAAEEPAMLRAKEFILARGGIGKANVFTRIWLALFGQFDWRWTPRVPPEIILLPNWLGVNIYEFGSWSRATIMALSIVSTTRPVCQVPQGAGVEELYLEPEGQRKYPLGKVKRLLSWHTFFLAFDSFAKFWDRLPFKPGRGLALRRAVKWVVAHQEADGSWGGIMLPWIYSLMALKSLGYPLTDPVVARGLKGLEGFICEDAATLRLQPATSPVWDTAWSLLALQESGLAGNHPALTQAARWLLGEQIHTGGDWQVKNRRTEPGCWSFEFDNDLYPDIDDTAVVARALARVQLPSNEEQAKAKAIALALAWVTSMQCRDGGWAAFDRDNDQRILDNIPFADFMSPLDPTCADVTAHAIEFLGEMRQGGTVLRRALSYLAATQEADGAWYGRWGVNYLYGTGLVLTSLAAVQNSGHCHVDTAVSWLVAHQNADGGWGESCRSYETALARGAGVSTASQTAWALMGLIAAGRGSSQAVHAGVNYLLRTQQADGSWQEAEFTGTGFPRAFYLRYDQYRIYFPLLALARFKSGLEKNP